MLKFLKFLFIGFVFLDTAIFPYSCSYSEPEREDIVVWEIVDEKGHNIYVDEYRVTLNSSIKEYDIANLPKGRTYSNWVLLTPEGTEKEITFPYEYQQSDIHGYYYGRRSCVVFQTKVIKE